MLVAVSTNCPLAHLLVELASMVVTADTTVFLARRAVATATGECSAISKGGVPYI